MLLIFAHNWQRLSLDGYVCNVSQVYVSNVSKYFMLQGLRQARDIQPVPANYSTGLSLSTSQKDRSSWETIMPERMKLKRCDRPYCSLEYIWSCGVLDAPRCIQITNKRRTFSFPSLERACENVFFGNSFVV